MASCTPATAATNMATSPGLNAPERADVMAHHNPAPATAALSPVRPPRVHSSRWSILVWASLACRRSVSSRARRNAPMPNSRISVAAEMPVSSWRVEELAPVRTVRSAIPSWPAAWRATQLGQQRGDRGGQHDAGHRRAEHEQRAEEPGQREHRRRPCRRRRRRAPVPGPRFPAPAAAGPGTRGPRTCGSRPDGQAMRTGGRWPWPGRPADLRAQVVARRSAARRREPGEHQRHGEPADRAGARR